MNSFPLHLVLWKPEREGSKVLENFIVYSLSITLDMLEVRVMGQ